jgi:hypothetical protein
LFNVVFLPVSTCRSSSFTVSVVGQWGDCWRPVQFCFGRESYSKSGIVQDWLILWFQYGRVLVWDRTSVDLSFHAPACVPGTNGPIAK